MRRGYEGSVHIRGPWARRVKVHIAPVSGIYDGAPEIPDYSFRGDGAEEDIEVGGVISPFGFFGKED